VIGHEAAGTLTGGGGEASCGGGEASCGGGGENAGGGSGAGAPQLERAASVAIGTPAEIMA